MPFNWTKEKKESAIKDILEHISSGKSARSIIDNADREVIPAFNTFLEWVSEDKELAKQYARAMEARQNLLFEEILEIADKQEADVIQTEDGEIINHNVINRNRLQIDARKWALAKMNPKVYGTKHDVHDDEDATLLPTKKIAVTLTVKDYSKKDE